MIHDGVPFSPNVAPTSDGRPVRPLALGFARLVGATASAERGPDAPGSTRLGRGPTAMDAGGSGCAMRPVAARRASTASSVSTSSRASAKRAVASLARRRVTSG